MPNSAIQPVNAETFRDESAHFIDPSVIAYREPTLPADVDSENVASRLGRLVGNHDFLPHAHVRSSPIEIAPPGLPGNQQKILEPLFVFRRDFTQTDHQIVPNVTSASSVSWLPRHAVPRGQLAERTTIMSQRRYHSRRSPLPFSPDDVNLANIFDGPPGVSALDPRSVARLGTELHKQDIDLSLSTAGTSSIRHTEDMSSRRSRHSTSPDLHRPERPRTASDPLSLPARGTRDLYHELDITGQMASRSSDHSPSLTVFVAPPQLTYDPSARPSLGSHGAATYLSTGPRRASEVEDDMRGDGVGAASARGRDEKSEHIE